MLVLWLTLLAGAALAGWRWRDRRAESSLWAQLRDLQPPSPPAFELAMLADLPQPARRFFRFAIEPGTPLWRVADVSMHGQFSLGSQAQAHYMPMRARQIIAAPHGFVWVVKAGGALRFVGSDAAYGGDSWSRFWLYGILPVARAGGNDDHARAAFGRYIAEAVFWTPAALLPAEHVQWQAIDDTTARVNVTHGDLQQSVDLVVAADGRLTEVRFQRWSDANPARTFQLQPFGGYLSEYRNFSGFHLPTRIDAGNFFGTDAYFPFFRATVSDVRFP